MAKPTAFLRKLFEIVTDPTTDAVVRWSLSGESFVIADAAVFMEEIVPGYFKLTKFDSFHRQLNAYGFNKVRGVALEFENANFKRGQPQLLVNMKRNNPPRCVQNNEIQQENVQLQEEEEMMDVDINHWFNHGAQEMDWNDAILFGSSHFSDF